MDTLSIILILLACVLLAGLGVWLFIVIAGRKDEDSEDENIIINFMPQYTAPVKGHFLGSEKTTVKVGARQLIEFAPKDIKYKDIKDHPELADPVKVIADESKVITLPLGDASGYRHIKIILPPNPENLPNSLKNHPFGKALMKYIEKINGNTTEASIIREGSTRKTKLLNKLGDGEISEEFIEVREELTKDLLKSVTESKPSPTKFNYPMSQNTAG